MIWMFLFLLQHLKVKEKQHSNTWLNGVVLLHNCFWINATRYFKKPKQLVIMVRFILGLPDRHKAVGRIVWDAKRKLFDRQHSWVQGHWLVVFVATARTGLGVYGNAIKGFSFLAEVKPPDRVNAEINWCQNSFCKSRATNYRTATHKRNEHTVILRVANSSKITFGANLRTDGWRNFPASSPRVSDTPWSGHSLTPTTAVCCTK